MPHPTDSKTKGKILKKYQRNNKSRFAAILFALLSVAFSCLLLFAACDDGLTLPEGSGDGYPPSEWTEGELRVHFLDVGQGDCTLLQLPDGKNILIDGGDGSSEHDRKIGQYLDAAGVDKLDYMILTHSDRDHCGGLESVLEEVSVSCAYLPYAATLADDETYFSLYESVVRQVPSLRFSRRYETICGENGEYFFFFLWPYTDNDAETDSNYNSAVIWLEYEGLSVLFAGDMTTETEDMLAAEYALDPSVFTLGDMEVRLESTEVLKVAHHGSNTSSGREWLELLTPEAAVISCGRDNDYGHPSDRVLSDLRAVSPDGEIYRTDESGDIVLTSAGGGKYSFFG